ncbi:MAG: sigma-70 family RNA polymerase sigma factor [Actinobacteria bacterium]|nr:sigma-70 family RNA polymerase sigma factor [Actinomycetota bacterium]
MAAQPRPDRAFERLYRRHATPVYRYAYGMLRNQADAEDVTQTTFLNAFRALERGDEPRAPLNWLISIAHNVCLQRFRAASRRPSEVELDRDVADVLVDDDTPAAEDITRALGHLAFNQRAAIVLREIEGRSYAEIAEILGMTTSAVETLLFRARRALREQLEASFTCAEAELAISKQLDKKLSRAEKSQLRAHLRECPECATLARRRRGRRSALRTLGSIPLPPALAGFLSGGGASVGIGVVAKATAVAVTAGAVGLGSLDLHHALVPKTPHAKAPVARKVSAPPVSHTTGRALVPIPRGHATGVPRGIPIRRDGIASDGRREIWDEHRQQTQRGHRLARGQGWKAGRQTEGTGGGSHRSQGWRGRGGDRGAGWSSHAAPQEKEHGH